MNSTCSLYESGGELDTRADRGDAGSPTSVDEIVEQVGLVLGHWTAISFYDPLAEASGVS